MSNRKWILISGGSRGIGKATGIELARSGYNIVFTYLNNEARARDVIDTIRVSAPESFMLQCDMSDLESVIGLGRTLREKNIRLYGIVNNAGVTRDSLSINMTPAEWREVINTNLNAVFYVTHVFLRDLIADGEDRRLINISSVTGVKGNVGQINYAATKAALTGMVKTLAVELGPLSVRVNNISPGYINTEMTERLSDAEKRKLLKTIPARRFGEVSDVSHMVNFLLGPGGHYITGQNFIIDGGLTA